MDRADNLGDLTLAEREELIRLLDIEAGCLSLGVEQLTQEQFIEFRIKERLVQRIGRSKTTKENHGHL